MTRSVREISVIWGIKDLEVHGVGAEKMRVGWGLITGLCLPQLLVISRQTNLYCKRKKKISTLFKEDLSGN